jgi:hypothetical protein
VVGPDDRQDDGQDDGQGAAGDPGGDDQAAPGDEQEGDDDDRPGIDPGIDLGGDDDPGDDDPGDDDPGDDDPGDDDPVDDDPPVDDPEPEECVYPEFGREIRFGEVFPRMRWDSAFDETGADVGLDLQDLYCNQEFITLTIFVGALWCPSCSEYLARMRNEAPALARRGMAFLFVEVENNARQLASSAEANRYLNDHIGNTVSWRVGDRDTRPQPLIYGAPTIQGFPAGYIVRLSDMRVIADQGASEFVLPYEAIAANPNNDWSQFGGGGAGGGNNGGPGPGPANCDEGDEEEFEPNDQPGQAAEIDAGSFDGGICNGAPDFFEIDIRGRWRLDLEFENAVGDLDVYAVTPDGQNALERPDGTAIGSDSVDDNESFTHEGRTLVLIQGYEGATNTYTLTLTDLGGR